MTALLVDTSAWVEHLRDTRSAAALEVARLLAEAPQDLVTAPPVVMELLAGARDERAVELLSRLVASLPVLALDPALDWSAAATVYRAARRQGRTVRGLVDCLLAVVAERHDVVLVHRDADLALLGDLLPRLRTRDLR